MRILREKWATKGEGKGAEKELNARENVMGLEKCFLFTIFSKACFLKKRIRALKNGNVIFWNEINL